MLTRREALAQMIAGASVAAAPKLLMESIAEDPLVSKADLAYLRDLTKKTIASATKSESIPKLGFAYVTPGGAYPAFWIRDFSMAVGCGLLPAETIRQHLRLIAKCQNSPEPRKLSKGALIPPFAIPDHINYDGGAVFFPGTYASGDDQGGEPYGVLPPVDDHYEFIHLAHVCHERDRSASFLDEKIEGLSMFDRLERAIDCPRYNPESGLVETLTEERAVGFGFCDGVYLTGSLLFGSLLRLRALNEMIKMAAVARRMSRLTEWSNQRSRIIKSIEPTFMRDGWLRAATGVGSQPDVWGTAYAIYSDATSRQLKSKLRATLIDAVKKGTITYRGAVRHVPTDHDFSPNSAWEKTAGIPLNRYQNGAYWHVPTGWLARAIWPVDRPLARKIVKDMVDHFREEESKGAPWECIHPDQNYQQNPVYMASVSLPLECLSS